jgi:hypothetical protein
MLTGLAVLFACLIYKRTTNRITLYAFPLYSTYWRQTNYSPDDKSDGQAFVLFASQQILSVSSEATARCNFIKDSVHVLRLLNSIKNRMSFKVKRKQKVKLFPMEDYRVVRC